MLKQLQKGLVLLMLVSLVVGMAVGCGGQNETQESEQPEQQETAAEDTGEPQPGGELVITDMSFDSAKTLDPHQASAAGSMRYVENMYNTLLRYKKGTYGELEEDLAKDYSVSEDGKVYTFNLQQGVKFHNGDELTAEDVKYSVNRIIDQEVRASHFDALEEIQTPDQYTVKFVLEKPVAPFLTFLAYPMNAVVNKQAVKQNDGNIDNVDAGSGPFQLGEWKKDQHLVLNKFKDYFKEGKPYLDTVKLRPIPDETARTTALRNEEVDMILQVASKNVKTLEKETGIQVNSVPGSWWEYVGLNTTKEPFDDKKVRQAIAWGIDRQELINMVKFGMATRLADGPIPPGHWAHNSEQVYPERDVEKAKKLLAEAGYPDGFKTEMIVLPKENNKNAAQVIKQQMKDLGIEVNIRSLESSVYFNKLGNKEFEMTQIGWVGFVDPDEFLYNIFHTGEKWNQQGYSNKQVDKLLEKGRTTIDQEKRKKIYTEAQTIIAEDSPLVFLYVNEQISALWDKVKGFDVNPTVSTISLEETWLEQ